MINPAHPKSSSAVPALVVGEAVLVGQDCALIFVGTSLRIIGGLRLIMSTCDSRPIIGQILFGIVIAQVRCLSLSTTLVPASLHQVYIYFKCYQR